MALAQEAVKQAKNDVAAYINCGRLSLKIGDAIGGLECLEVGRKLDPENVKIKILIAESYVQLGTADEGLKQLEQAIQADASNTQLWACAGEILYGLKRFEKAKTHYSKTTELDAENNAAKLGLASTYLALKEIKQAKAIALKLAGNQATDSIGHYLLGLIAIEEENPAMVVIPLSKTTRADPSNIEAWLVLANAYVKLKKPE